MAERIATMMSMITITFIVVTVAAIVRGIYIVRQKNRESKMREAMYFNRMKMDNEKKKAALLEEQKNKEDSDAQGVDISEGNSVDVERKQTNESSVDKGVVEESKEEVKKEVQIDWLTGEPIFEDK